MARAVDTLGCKVVCRGLGLVVVGLCGKGNVDLVTTFPVGG